MQQKVVLGWHLKEIVNRTCWHSRQGVFSGLLFAGVCPGPNFAEFQKTRAGGPLGKFDIARLHGHFKRRGLQQNVVLGWHLKEMQVRTCWHSRQNVFSGLLFAGVCPSPNFAEFQKTRAGSPLGKFDIARLHGHFKRRGLQQKVVLGWHLKEILVRACWHSRQGVFSGLLFAEVCPGPNFAEFQKTGAGGPLGKFDIARLHGHFKRRSLQQNVVLDWHLKEMLVKTCWHSRQGVFSGLLFAGVCPGPNFAEFQKTRAGGPLGKFDIARLHGHFKRRGLQQNVVLGWHLKEILLRTCWHSRQNVFSGLLFAEVCPGPNFAEFQKTRAGGPLGKFDIARLHGHFKRRGLQQKVVLGWHLKELLVRTCWHSRQGVFSGLLFAGLCPGPNFAEFQKTRAGGPLGKFDIARLHGHFKRRGLQQNVVLGWHLKEILVRTCWHSRQGVFSGLLFAGVCPGPNFAEFQETSAGGPLGKFDIARLHGHFKRRGLQQNVVLGWHLKEIVVKTCWHSRQGVFSSLLFAGVCPGPNFAEFQKTRAGGPLGKFDIARLHGHFKRRGLQQNVVLGWHLEEIVVRTCWHSRQGVFSGLLFAGVCPGPNFAEFQKTRAGGPLGKFDIARLHGHFKRRGLPQNVVLGWHLKEILVRTCWHSRQGVFSGLLFAGVCPGPNFAEFQKTRAGGPLGKFDIARLHGHFKRRGLQQNVVLGWHLKEIVVKTCWHSRQGVFSSLLFAGVCPGPNFAEFQKTRAGGPLGKFDIARLHGHFKRRGLQQNVVLGWHLKEIVVRTCWNSRQGVFSGLLFAGVCPGPNFAEFQKTRAGGPLGKFDIARLHGHFKRRGLQQNVVLGWHLKEILLRTCWHSRQNVFSGLLFAEVCPGPNFAEFQKTRAGGPLGKFDIARLHGHFKRRGLQQKVVLGSHLKELLVRTCWHSRQGVFSSLLFAGLCPGPNFAEFQKTRAGGPLGKFDIARLHGHFKRRGLQQNVVLGWHLKEIVVRTCWHSCQGVFSGLLFAGVCPGPNFAEFQETSAGGPLGKFDIARLHGHFKRRGLQQNVVLGWHLKEIVVKTCWHSRQGVFSSLLFAGVCPGPNFAEFQKTRAGGPLGKFDIARLHGHFKRRGLQQNVVLGWHLEEIVVRTCWHSRQGVFSGLLFAGVCPGPNFAEFQKTRAGGPLGKFDIARLHGHFKRRGLPQNVVLGWHLKEILVRTCWHSRQGVFSGLLFAGVCPGPNFAEFQKTRAGGPLGKFDIARLHGHFKRRGLQQNVVLGWHLKEIVVKTCWHSRQGVFSSLLFAGVCPGPNFAEFQKTRAGGPLGKFDIARLHGHFKRRGLQQNVVLGWHLKEIVVRTCWNSRQGVFSGLLFAGVCPGPNFAEFQKTRAGGPLGKFDIARLHGHFKRRGLPQNVVLGWHLKEILVRTCWHSRQGVFSGLLFAGVCPGPNFAEFQKTRAGGPLGKFDIAQLHGHFKRRDLQQKVVLGWHLKEMLVRTCWHSRQGVFSGLLFAGVCPGPNFAEFQKTRAGGPLGKFDIAGLHGHFKRRDLQQNVVLGWHLKEILVRTCWHLRQNVFSGPLFAGVCPGPNFAEFQKTRAGGPLGKFDIARLHGHFKRRGLKQKVVLG